MKNRIIVARAVKEVNENGILTEKAFIEFYLKTKEGAFWLFTQPFSKGVYDWFKDGRAEGEILSFTKWKNNERLGKTIARIPREIRYVQKYVIAEERVA